MLIDALPNDLDALRALVSQLSGERDAAIAESRRLTEQNDKLRHLLKQLQRAQFGQRSERLDRDQMQLALEDIETALANRDAEEEEQQPNNAADKPADQRKKRRINRGALPAHLPHVHVTIEPESTVCPCCQGAMHVIGEESSQRLDKIPAQYQVIVTHRPKYGCRACEGAVVQAPAPERLIKNGIPTEALVANVVVDKFAWHSPLYRQAQIMKLQGLPVDRSTLAFWVGVAAAELKPIYLRMKEILLGSAKIAVDETRAPVLDPGRGRTKTGYFWAISRDDRPWAGSDPPGVVYTYAPGRGGVHATALLAGYSGIVQCDGYEVYKQLANPTRDGGPVTLAYCWLHWRRYFFDIDKDGPAPIAHEALQRIAALYAIESRIRGRSAEERRAVRQAETKPLVEKLKAWLENRLIAVSEKSTIAEAIRYGLTRWDGLVRFLDDGRIEMGRVEMWRGCGRPNISVSAPFVWRCLTNSTLAPSPHPARQTGRADFPHPAFSRPVRPSLSAGRHVALERCRGRVSRKDTRLGSGETRRLVVSSGASTSGGPVVQCMLG
jgi:transposase